MKTLGVAFFLGVGVFGGGFLSTLGGIGKDVALEAKRSAEGKSKGVSTSASSSRGALTKLTRREINAKLAQVPVFFVKNPAGGVYIDEAGEGKFFETKSEAEKYAAKCGSVVGAATMDEVFYPLLKKSQKLSVSGPIAANSKPEGKYVLVPLDSELKNAGGAAFTGKHPADFPLYRVPKLAFNREPSGLEFPLFTEISSATGAYERLQEDKAEKGGKPTQQQEKVRPEDYQVTSLLDVVELWGVGGSEGRTLEIYPSMDEINNYKSLR